MRAPLVYAERPATPGPWPLLLIAPAKEAGPDAPFLRRLATAGTAAGYLAVRFEWRFKAQRTSPSEDLSDEARQLGALAAEWEANPEVRPGHMVLAAKSFGSRVAVRSPAFQQAKAFMLLTPNADAEHSFPANYAPLRGWNRPVVTIIAADDPYGNLPQIRAGHRDLGLRGELHILPRGDHDFRTKRPGDLTIEEEALGIATRFLRDQNR